MQEIIVEIMNSYGYLGVFVMITIENIFPPIPSEIILTFGGFMTTYSELHVWGVIAAATAGSVLGAIILYIVGRVLNAERLGRILDGRLGRILRLKKEDVFRAERWFLRRGTRAVLLCRFVPIVRSLISIPAGVSKMRFSTFLAMTTLGTLVWNIVLVYLGRAAGAAWEKTAHYFDVYSLIAAGVLVVAAGVIGFVFIKKRFMKH